MNGKNVCLFSYFFYSEIDLSLESKKVVSFQFFMFSIDFRFSFTKPNNRRKQKISLMIWNCIQYSWNCFTFIHRFVWIMMMMMRVIFVTIVRKKVICYEKYNILLYHSKNTVNRRKECVLLLLLPFLFFFLLKIELLKVVNIRNYYKLLAHDSTRAGKNIRKSILLSFQTKQINKQQIDGRNNIVKDVTWAMHSNLCRWIHQFHLFLHSMLLCDIFTFVLRFLFLRGFYQKNKNPICIKFNQFLRNIVEYQSWVVRFILLLCLWLSWQHFRQTTHPN